MDDRLVDFSQIGIVDPYINIENNFIECNVGDVIEINYETNNSIIYLSEPSNSNAIEILNYTSNNQGVYSFENNTTDVYNGKITINTNEPFEGYINLYLTEEIQYKIYINIRTIE